MSDITSKKDQGAFDPRAPCKCYFCDKIFPSFFSLRPHLANCRKRQHERIIQCGDWEFHIKSNPRRRELKAIMEFISEYPPSANEPLVIEKMILAICEFLRLSGRISSYSYVDLTKSKK